MGGLLIDTLAYQFIDTWRHKNESYSYYDLNVYGFLRLHGKPR